MLDSAFALRHQHLPCKASFDVKNFIPAVLPALEASRRLPMPRVHYLRLRYASHVAARRSCGYIAQNSIHHNDCQVFEASPCSVHSAIVQPGHSEHTHSSASKFCGRGQDSCSPMHIVGLVWPGYDATWRDNACDACKRRHGPARYRRRPSIYIRSIFVGLQICSFQLNHQASSLHSLLTIAGI